MKSAKYGAEILGKSKDVKDPESATKTGYTYWIENGVYYQSPLVDSNKFGPHEYAMPGMCGMGSCSCGCHMGQSSSSGDCDPFGACPENPNPFHIAEGNETSESNTPRTDAEANDGWSGDAICVSADFARQLERELDDMARAVKASDKATLAACLQMRAHGVEFGSQQLIACLNRLEEMDKERDALKAEVEALRKDKARLDWLENIKHCYHVKIMSQPHGKEIYNSHPMLLEVRFAISQAMKGKQ